MLNKDIRKIYIDENELAAIEGAQRLLADPELHAGLVAVSSEFNRTPTTITALDDHGLALEDQLSLVEDLGRKLRAIPRNLQAVSDEFRMVIEANPGCVEMSRVRDFLRGQIRGDQFAVAPEDLIHMEFA